MNESAVTHAQRGYRFMQIAAGGLVLLFSVVTLALIYWLEHLIMSFVIILFVFLLAYMPLLYVKDDLRLVTDRSPAQVRDEFQGVDNPLAISAYALADEGGVDVHEDGATYESTLLFGQYTVRIRYATEQRPNGNLIVQSWKNGSESTTSTVTVEPADGTGTLVTVRGERSGRISLRSLFLLLVRTNQLVAAWEAYGYDLIEDKTHIGLR
jgi:hypothetical protein